MVRDIGESAKTRHARLIRRRIYTVGVSRGGFDNRTELSEPVESQARAPAAFPGLGGVCMSATTKCMGCVGAEPQVHAISGNPMRPDPHQIQRIVNTTYNRWRCSFVREAEQFCNDYHRSFSRSLVRRRSRAFPSSFLPVPSAPQPQNASLSEFYENS